MSREKAMMIAKEFLRSRNPGHWNGEGDKPSNFDTKLFFFETRSFPFLNYSLSFEWEPLDEDEIGPEWVCVCRCWGPSLGPRKKINHCRMLDSKHAICDLILSVS